MTDEPVLMTSREVAALFAVDVTTVRKWCKTGKLGVIKTPGGQNRHSTEEVRRLYQERKEG